MGSQRFTGSGRSRCKVRAGVLIIFIVYRETLVREKPDEEIQEKERKKERKERSVSFVVKMLAKLKGRVVG